jgi:hypothetical protein
MMRRKKHVTQGNDYDHKIYHKNLSKEFKNKFYFSLAQNLTSMLLIRQDFKNKFHFSLAQNLTG